MRINKDYWLLNTPISHRGLWGNGIIENSICAYENAVKNGFAIEIDLYLTKDNHLVSFHDKTLERMTGADGFIYDKTLNELNNLYLLDSDYQIPTFEQVLSVVDGKVPLLIEIKDQPDKSVVDKVCERLKLYKGEFAIQSFNPFYINKVKKLAPEFIRGILATETHGKDLKPLTRFIVKNMSLNFLIKPDFISYSFEDLPLKKSKVKNIPLITWTITNNEIYEKVKPYAQNVIFEHFIPSK